MRAVRCAQAGTRDRLSGASGARQWMELPRGKGPRLFLLRSPLPAFPGSGYVPHREGTVAVLPHGGAGRHIACRAPN